MFRDAGRCCRAAAVAVFFLGVLGANMVRAASAPLRLELYLAGSSAHEPGLLSLLRLTQAGGMEICTPGSLHVYATGRDERTGLDTVYRCQAGVDAGLGKGSWLVLVKTARGGSGGGLGALLRGPSAQVAGGGQSLNLAFLASDEPQLLATSGVSRPAAGPLAAYVFHGGVPVSLVQQRRAPDVVLSDMEPAQFTHALQPALTEAELGKLQSQSIASVIYGVPLTRGLWQRLQALEFPPTSSCHPQHPGYGDINRPDSRANALACMPSISKAQLQGLLSGLLQDWRELESSLAEGANAANVTVAGVPPLSSGQVFVERREAGAESARAFEIFFNPSHCADRNLADTQSPAAHVSHSDSALLQRLTRHDAAGRGGIGLLPTSLVAAADDRWRFVKISGTPPSLRAAVTGQWELWFEGSLHLRRVEVGELPAASPTISAFARVLARGLGHPSVLRHLNAGTRQLFGPAGLMANGLHHAAAAPRSPLVLQTVGSGLRGDLVDRPVALTTRGLGSATQACSSPVLVGPAPAEPY